MKPFRTELTLPPAPFLARDRPIFTLGSCFAEHIGQRLLDFKWQGLNAPFGALFHPLALSKLLRLAVAEADLEAELFVEHDGAFFHHDLHSRFFAQDPEALQEKWRKVAASVRAILKLSPCVFVTLGTAWVYERKADGQLVANCHKKPLDHFHKRLLRAHEIQAAIKDIRAALPASLPLILTLSPVRHIKDTLMGNAWSKSLLFTGIHEFLSHNEGLYFPAYEIMLDDLRDYRFYESDMIHPSQDAIDYIWEKFTATYMTEASQAFLKDWQSILNTLKHRPLRVDAPSYQKHVKAMIERLDSYSDLDCSQERLELRSRLIS
jgi:hypothetical protein